MVRKVNIKEDITNSPQDALNISKCQDILNALNTRYVGSINNLNRMRNTLAHELENVMDGYVTVVNYKFEDEIPNFYVDDLTALCRQFMDDINTAYIKAISDFKDLQNKYQLDRKD